MLKSDYSLPEARVMFELDHSGGRTAKELTEELKIDAGYFSRIIKRLIKNGLVRREQSSEDGRAYRLYLTEKGKETFSQLDRLSSRQISGLLEKIPPDRLEKLVLGMRSVEEGLQGGSPAQGGRVTLRNSLRPGDVGRLISLHGWIYDKECGYDHTFEGYVCKTFYDFLKSYSPQKDKVWFLEDGGQMVGAIAIVEHTAEKAQLRWFILHPDYRGLGLGSRLMGKAMAYCREKGYRSVFLLTTKDQQTAIRMYEKARFQKVSEQDEDMWGKHLTELIYEWHPDETHERR